MNESDPNYCPGCPGCEPDGFYAHTANCPNLVDVEVSTEGARHVPAAELRERSAREVLKANLRAAAAHPIIAPGSDEFLCAAETRVKRNFVNHTHRCSKPAGHDGGHEWSDGAGRTVIWYGEVQSLPTNMRYRFGLDPHWLMKPTGRKTMAGDFDSEW